jgi:hypothetical protein
VYSTYFGDGENDSVAGMAIDHFGLAVLAGSTKSADFPVTPGAFDTTLGGTSDAFVTKLDAAGVKLAYSTFLGGSATEGAVGIGVGPLGDIYVVGGTASPDFPVTPGAFDTIFDSGAFYVTKLDSTGARLAYSTFLDLGPGYVQDVRMAVDALDQVCLVGKSWGGLNTTVGAYDTSYNGGWDAFALKLDLAGSSLAYSTYLGGRLGQILPGEVGFPGGEDEGVAVAVDATGSAYVAGPTISLDFPTTVGAYDASWNGNVDVFVTKLGADGTTLAWSTYLGGRDSERGTSIVVDWVGNVFVAGSSNGTNDFPTTPGALETRGGNAFLTKLDSSGSTLIYSTYLPQAGDADAIAIDELGYAYVTGWTISEGLPTTSEAYDRTYNGMSDVYLMKVDPAGATLVYCTYLGGAGPDFALGLALDPLGHAYVVGRTMSSDFPTTPAAVDTTYGGRDAFVTKLDPNGANLVFSTFLGGTGEDVASGVAVDAVGHAHVTGATESTDFFTTAGAYDTSWNGSYDAFVTKLDAAGGLVYSTYLGGITWDAGAGIAIDASGHAYVTGRTGSIDFPTTPGAFDTSYNYLSDAFVTTLDINGAAVVSSTFLGGSNDDAGAAIALDSAGNAYVTGYTNSPNFPTTPGAFDARHEGTREAFVAKLGAVGQSSPGVNITANGSDGPVSIGAGDPLRIVVSFDVGGGEFVDAAEVYIGVNTPVGRLWYDAPSRTLVPGLRPAYIGPLTSFGPGTLIDLPNASSLRVGEYSWFVWVDYDLNGVPNGGTFDTVLTIIGGP